ncbi:MAG: hypothetical protein M1822_006316 [Bathelium mastoideum]|nr:MAG: hypothetical protein M1822_006316 [Bathelium mastoideum]
MLRRLPTAKLRLRFRTSLNFLQQVTLTTSSIVKSLKDVPDPRLSEENLIEDQFATIRDKYDAPKYPLILAHGLFGFDQLRLLGEQFPGIQYWRGITEALATRGVEVITAAVPPSGSIEARAEKLAECIRQKAHGKSVNIIGHSMDSGLDSRYMISRLHLPDVNVLSLTTIASPHRGSAFADYLFKRIGPTQLPKMYKIMESFGLETGAFSQLTRDYMLNEFNPKTPDLDTVRCVTYPALDPSQPAFRRISTDRVSSYFSYGATVEPALLSMFRQSHRIIQEVEGPNDGLVSVKSSKWGMYQGTLVDVSHLDLINWTNRLRWMVWELTGNRRNFNAIAFYLDIADMLAKEGL